MSSDTITNTQFDDVQTSVTGSSATEDLGSYDAYSDVDTIVQSRNNMRQLQSDIQQEASSIRDGNFMPTNCDCPQCPAVAKLLKVQPQLLMADEKLQEAEHHLSRVQRRLEEHHSGGKTVDAAYRRMSALENKLDELRTERDILASENAKLSVAMMRNKEDEEERVGLLEREVLALKQQYQQYQQQQHQQFHPHQYEQQQQQQQQPQYQQYRQQPQPPRFSDADVDTILRENRDLQDRLSDSERRVRRYKVRVGEVKEIGVRVDQLAAALRDRDAYISKLNAKKQSGKCGSQCVWKERCSDAERAREQCLESLSNAPTPTYTHTHTHTPEAPLVTTTVTRVPKHQSHKNKRRGYTGADEDEDADALNTTTTTTVVTPTTTTTTTNVCMSKRDHDKDTQREEARLKQKLREMKAVAREMEERAKARERQARERERDALEREQARAEERDRLKERERRRRAHRPRTQQQGPANDENNARLAALRGDVERAGQFRPTQPLEPHTHGTQHIHVPACTSKSVCSESARDVAPWGVYADVNHRNLPRPQHTHQHTHFPTPL